MLPIVACGAGIYLGLYFNILALLPFTVLGAGAFMVLSSESGQSLFDSTSLLLFPMISVQAGYMLGLTARETYGQLLARLNIGQSKRI
jgi:nitric oxide reductase large subunit